MNTELSPRIFDNPKDGKPKHSWWVTAKPRRFTQRCQREWKRMRLSKEHHRMGLPMVVGALDGKSARTS